MSLNAFATSLDGPTRITNGHQEDGESVRATKRVRLSEEATAAIHTQCVPDDTSLDVDYMILDYVVYRAIKACLASRLSSEHSSLTRSLSSSLAMSDAFLSIFKARYPDYQPDAELRLRILLLKLATLFTQRLTSNLTNPTRSALQTLRATNLERARTWIQSADRIPSAQFDTSILDSELPVTPQELERNRAHVLKVLDIPAEDEDYVDAFYGTRSCVALLDILPVFVRVSAARNAMSNSTLNEFWMQLACEFMLQACLEQYLVFGTSGSDAIDEAFAWGHKDVRREDGAFVSEHILGLDGPPEIPTDEVNDMFEDEDFAIEVEGWAAIRTSYLNQLVPAYVDSSGDKKIGANAHASRSTEFVSHLELTATKHPIDEFEALMLKFMAALSNSIPQPVLVQLENGSLEGMTEQETADFLTDCGVPATQLFDDPIGFKGGDGLGE